MTKTLTEQWKDLELPEGLYYFKTRYNNIFIGYPRERNMFRTIDDGLFDESDKIEVLAPVPSYDELTLMAGNYRLAKKALRDCYNEMKYWATMNHRCSKIFNHIKAALVEIEEVK